MARLNPLDLWRCKIAATPAFFNNLLDALSQQPNSRIKLAAWGRIEPWKWAAIIAFYDDSLDNLHTPEDLAFALEGGRGFFFRITMA